MILTLVIRFLRKGHQNIVRKSGYLLEMCAESWVLQDNVSSELEESDERFSESLKKGIASRIRNCSCLEETVNETI